MLGIKPRARGSKWQITCCIYICEHLCIINTYMQIHSTKYLSSHSYNFVSFIYHVYHMNNFIDSFIWYNELKIIFYLCIYRYVCKYVFIKWILTSIFSLIILYIHFSMYHVYIHGNLIYFTWHGVGGVQKKRSRNWYRDQY